MHCCLYACVQVCTEACTGHTRYWTRVVTTSSSAVFRWYLLLLSNFVMYHKFTSHARLQTIQIDVVTMLIRHHVNKRLHAYMSSLHDIWMHESCIYGSYMSCLRRKCVQLNIKCVDMLFMHACHFQLSACMTFLFVCKFHTCIIEFTPSTFITNIFLNKHVCYKHI